MDMKNADGGGDGRTSQDLRPVDFAEVKTGAYLGRIDRPKGYSSRRRIKPEGGAACFHLMSRTINGEMLFGPTEKESFRRMMWRMAKFAGVEIFTYAVMSNHFHILVKIPERTKWLKRFESKEGEDVRAGEERLLEHLAIIYSKAFLKQLRGEIASYRSRGMEAEVEVLLQKFKNRFCDVSLFVKELKERFSRWFNKLHERRGTLWMERFKSVCVDGEAALATMAAYIDLNPVRAGMVKDPLDYEWSGYGEAMSGSRRAKRGLCKALSFPQALWEEKAMPRYRLFLYDEGYVADDPRTRQKKEPKSGFSKAEREKVQEQKGAIGVSRMFRKRVSTFSTGVAIGGAEFVQKAAKAYRSLYNREKERKPKEITSMVDRSMNFHVLRE